MKNTSCDAEVFNVCTGQTTAITQLAKALSVISGVPLSIDKHPPRGGDIQMSLGDASKAQKHLNVKAITNLSDGLRHTVDFHRGQNAIAAE